MADGATEELLGRLAARVEARAGIRPPAWMLADRAAARAAALGRGLAAHLQALLVEEEELEVLTEALRVGETRFFRHAAQLEALRAALPAALERCRAARRPLRAWSAGCASGEEAWTLAMLLAADEGPADEAPIPEVLGTDLSEAALRVAEAGRYAADAATRVPPALAARFLRPAGEHVEIGEALRRAVRVRFARHNLLDERYPGPFDLIVCRNVLIYFEEARQRLIVDRLRARLEPGGALLLGPSEQHLLGTGPAGDGPVTGARGPERAWAGVAPGDGPVTGARGPERAWAGVAPGDGPVTGARGPERAWAGVAPGDGPVTGPWLGPSQVASQPGPDPVILKLQGSYGDGERLRRELQPLLAAGATLIVDLDGADYLGDDDGRVLRRAAEVLPLRLRAGKPAVQRWLRRQQLAAEGA